MLPRLATVGQDVGLLAARFFKGIGQGREAGGVERAFGHLPLLDDPSDPSANRHNEGSKERWAGNPLPYVTPSSAAWPPKPRLYKQL